MPDSTIKTPTSRGIIRAPRGTTLSCKGWQQEAALRMLMNNLDPEVAERPADLVVYAHSKMMRRFWCSLENPWESSARTNMPRAC